MADEQDQENKTEQPTQKRLEEAFKKGNIPFSREVNNFLMLAMLAITVTALAPHIFKNIQFLLLPFLADANNIPTDRAGLGQVLYKLAFGAMGIIAVPLLGAIVCALAASLLQNGFNLSFDPIFPRLDKISPIAGLKRLFSMRSVVEMVKSLVKIAIVGFVAFIAVYPEMAHIQQLPDSTTQALLLFLAMLAMRMTIGVAIAVFFIALFDIIYQRFQYTKSLRMSRQEIRDEYKQSEGDPVIKQRLRRLRQERARQRMMSAVPKADVVITNPTHFAVALQYDSKKMKAPTVTAKGQDLVALRMRDLAKEHNVPVVENPPLARALFASAELDQEIPFAHYEAVAKIISYVYQLKGRKV
jgi:flagellar biosynthetic protein FlhB